MNLEIIQATNAASLSIAYGKFIKDKEIVDVKTNIEKQNNIAFYVVLITYKELNK